MSRRGFAAVGARLALGLTLATLVWGCNDGILRPDSVERLAISPSDTTLWVGT